MTRRSYTFVVEPRGPLFSELLGSGLSYAETLGLVIQKWRNYPPSATDVLEHFSKYQIEAKDVDAWPGSRLAPGFTEQVRIYQYTPEVKEYLEFVSEGLFDWQNPELLDDPHLMRTDGSTWLGSTAHEDDAWLELTPNEYAELEQTAPNLAAILRLDEERSAHD